MTRRRLIATVGALAALALSAGVTASLGAAPKLSLTSISVSLSKDPQLASQVLAAQAEGYFKQVGLDVKIRTWADGSQIPSAMAAGKVDMAQSIESDALTIIGQGAPVHMIAGISNMSGTIGLVIPKGSTIAKPTDLEGKTIGGTKAAYLFRWIDGFCKFAKPTCDPAKINVVNVDPPDHPTVIQSKSVAGVISFEPYLDLSAQNGAKVVATGVGYTMAGYKRPGKIWSGQITLYARDSFVQDHKDVLVAYLKALQKANAWINADKARASKVLAPLFGLKQDLLVKMLKRNVYGLAIDKTFLNDVRDVGAFMVKDHEIPKNPPLSQSVDVSVLKAVDAHLVTATP
jgi:ABC-type nitrate/sulfonate/bicarbonate transport system substrate-binding protein